MYAGLVEGSADLEKVRDSRLAGDGIKSLPKSRYDSVSTYIYHCQVWWYGQYCDGVLCIHVYVTCNRMILFAQEHLQNTTISNAQLTKVCVCVCDQQGYTVT